MALKKQARLNNDNNPLNPTDSVLASLEQVSNSTSQPAIQPTSCLNLRKATFKIDSEVLNTLDDYHLRLQLNLGKRNAPFKETIVELALKDILEQAQLDPERLLNRLQQQQQQRSGSSA